MDNLINFYQQRLSLQSASFSRIDHEDAMVAIVYQVTQPNDKPLILKICARDNDYFRELYFLKYLADKLPVPRIVEVVPPESAISGAILMECLPGALLTKADFTDELAFEIGSLLARLHLNRVVGYGDPIQPNDLTPDPRLHFALKFEEGLAECSNHLSKELLERCRRYYDKYIYLLASVDGPCIVHRDFRPGNVMVYNGKLQGIIDWAGAQASFAEEDFCSMEHGEWPIHSTKKSFLAGYASVRPIPDYTEVMPLLRLSKAIAIIGFTVKRGTWENTNARVYQYNRQFLELFFSRKYQE